MRVMQSMPRAEDPRDSRDNWMAVSAEAGEDSEDFEGGVVSVLQQHGFWSKKWLRVVLATGLVVTLVGIAHLRSTQLQRSSGMAFSNEEELPTTFCADIMAFGIQTD